MDDKRWDAQLTKSFTPRIARVNELVIRHARLDVDRATDDALSKVTGCGFVKRAWISGRSMREADEIVEDVEIAQRYHGDPNGTMPLLPVVTLPEGATIRSPGVAAELKRIDERLKSALPGARIASYGSTGSDAFVSKDGRTAFALVYPRPDPAAQFGENTKAEKTARAALAGAQVAGAPLHLTGPTPASAGARPPTPTSSTPSTGASR